MDDGTRRCALPGCGVEIQTVSGRPERRYCSARHRAAARQARRAVHARQRVAAADRDLAGTLPWLGDPAALRDPGVGSAGPVLRPAARYANEAVASRAEPRARSGIGSRAASGEAGAEARVVSRAAQPGIVARAAAGRSRDRRRAARPRRRALVMIGVAGILAGGYAATARPEPPVPVQAAPDGRPGGESADTWAQRASVALAAVNTQLDTLARTEDRWEQLPASRSGAVPAPVAALEERRTVLERRRATLQSQLDTYRSLREAQQDLAESEQHLRTLEKALAAARPRSADDEAALAALDEQHDLRIRRRDAQRAELESLEKGVSTAVGTPLPDDAAVTDEVSRDVLEVVRTGGEPQRRDDPGPSRPEVVPGREPDGTTPRPEPPGSRDGGGERRDGATARPSSSTASEVDVLAELHEQARRVARDATPEVGPQRAVGRHRAPEKLQVTRVAIGIAHSRRAVPTADRTDGGPGAEHGLRTDGDGRAGGADERVAVRAVARMDDDAIEERNAARRPVG